MKPHLGLPADVMTLLVWPLLLMTLIGIAVGCAMPIFNWLHQPSKPAAPAAVTH